MVTICAHCGRTSDERVMAKRYMGIRCESAPMLNISVGQNLCHANLDGTKADPDCYHLVTVRGEKVGARRPIGLL